ncbi:MULTISPECIES: hypothetical protein [unclassified Saccharopolyspora]|uniref:hypothetical protein n=2 Tax=Pseudonocardiaceae TaxID=2070 RepID=UPI001909FC6B|nr:hypothetical protein [Saccharopolyspora sp. HNM0986]MBK0868128.1 hypothetical protein [Saccharopolyspora sp. HNM0986]
MTGYDGLVWRTLHRVLAVLAIGVLGLLIGLGSSASRSDSLLGVLVVALVALPVALTLRRMSPTARGNLRLLPGRRPLMTAQAVLLGLVAVLVLCWSAGNAIAPGTLAPLPLALVGVLLAAVLALLGWIGHRMSR